MGKDKKASISTVKIILIAIVLVMVLGIGVVTASNVKANSIKIVFPNDYELNIITTKTKVSEILEDNHIILLEDEIVTPELNKEIEKD